MSNKRVDCAFCSAQQFPQYEAKRFEIFRFGLEIFFVRATTFKAFINLGPQLLSVIANVRLRALCVSLLLEGRASLGQIVVQEARECAS